MTRCPMCDVPAPPLLDHKSGDPIANYYSCAACGHVWMSSKVLADAEGTSNVRCPQCDTPTARLLREMSHGGAMNYYMCDVCRYPWRRPKDDPSGATASGQ